MHHRYNYKYTIGKTLECLRKSINQHSELSISIHSNKTNQRKKIIEHIPDAFVKVVGRIISEWKNCRMIDKVDVKNRVLPEGKKVPSGENEIHKRFIKVIDYKKLNNIE